jgi:hypothetical protein
MKGISKFQTEIFRSTSKAATLLLLAGAMSITQAAPVAFTNISTTDGNDALGFSAVGTLANVDPGSNDLDLDITGYDIDGGATGTLLSDTLLVTVTAAPGEILRTITYSESGVYVAPASFVGASIQLLVNGSGPAPASFFTSNSSGGWGGNGAPVSQTIDVSVFNLTSAIVSISNQLIASPGGSILKDFSQLSIDTQAAAVVPLPPAMWLMGAAVVALVSVGRRQSV